MQRRRTQDNKINAKPLTKIAQQEFIKSISIEHKGQEAVVESAYWSALHKYFIAPNPQYSRPIFKPLNTDGLLMVNDLLISLSLLMEFKDDIELEKRVYQERILAQVVYYLKYIETHISKGNELQIEIPNVVLAADKNQVFVINARILYKYLKLNIDWKRPARLAYDTFSPPELFEALHNDNDINPYIFDLRAKDFSINDVFDLVNTLASSENNVEIERIPVRQANIRSVYDEFLRLVIKDKRQFKTNQELVTFFIRSLIDRANVSIQESKKAIIFLNGSSSPSVYKVDLRAWYAFFTRFESNYSAHEIANITEIADRLLEETERRFSGEYWTPTIWVNEATKLMDKNYGKKWKTDYVVWDAAAGTKNLTRDKKFEKLYSSTLFKDELNTSTMYNTGNESFQFDFLNDDIDMNPDSNSRDLKIPSSLFKSLKNNEPIIFYMNPPYGTPNDARKNGLTKDYIANTQIAKLMNEHTVNFSGSSRQLYAQFLFRIKHIKDTFNLTNVKIAFFMNASQFGWGSFWENFNTWLFEDFGFVDGFLFNASEFEGTTKSAKWGITFSIFDTESKNNGHTITLDLKELHMNGIQSIGNHTYRRVEGKDSLKNWANYTLRNRTGKITSDSHILQSSAFVFNETTSRRNAWYSDAIGSVYLPSNKVASLSEFNVYSGMFGSAGGFAVIPNNFESVVVNMAVQSIVDQEWFNAKDEFKKPESNILESKEFKEFIANSVLISIFKSPVAQQTSFRNVTFRNETGLNLINEWFFMSREEIEGLANINKNSEVGFDLQNSHERYVYIWLQEHYTELSEEGKQLLKMAKKVVIETFPQRKNLADDYDSFGFNSWDAGWIQITRMIKLGYKTESYDLFKYYLNLLEQKMKEQIYEFEILVK